MRLPAMLSCPDRQIFRDLSEKLSFQKARKHVTMLYDPHRTKQKEING